MRSHAGDRIRLSVGNFSARFTSSRGNSVSNAILYRSHPTYNKKLFIQRSPYYIDNTLMLSSRFDLVIVQLALYITPRPSPQAPSSAPLLWPLVFSRMPS